MSRSHLFVCVVPTAFGEMLQGRRVAESLVEAGDRVAFIAPAEVQAALAGAPVRKGVLARFAMELLDDTLRSIVRDGEYDTVCLVDLAAFALTYGLHALPVERLKNLHEHVVALDLWNLADGDRVYDFGSMPQALPAEVLALPRLVPVPFARPTAAGAYNAWPRLTPATTDERAATRARFALPTDARVILMPTAAWQEASAQFDPIVRESARTVPPLLLAHAARTGATLVHVGPAPWAAGSPAYRHLAALPPVEFQALLAAADAVLTTNLSATTIATALAVDVPVVAVTSRGGPGVAPYRVWPLGLSQLLGPVLADNPLLACLHTAELLDPASVDAAFAAAFARAPAWLATSRAYRTAVQALPSPASRYAELASRSPRPSTSTG